ncbi:hypothetical protein MMC30_000551, partial [Trapelia coarctata]|nr:hypothetical protein [Trapelia coarctata]
TDAAVIGITKDGDEYPRAYVVPKVGQEASEEDIIAFVAKRVTKYKRIQEVRFIDLIPKNPSGKILRKFLHEKAKDEGRAMAAKL